MTARSNDACPTCGLDYWILSPYCPNLGHPKYVMPLFPKDAVRNAVIREDAGIRQGLPPKPQPKPAPKPKRAGSWHPKKHRNL